MNGRVSEIRTVPTIVVMAALMMSIASARADTINVRLSGSEETPPVTTSASGTAKFTIGKDKSVTGTVKTSGIDGIAAHIHLGVPGQAGPPIITLVKGAMGDWTVPPDSKLTDDQFASLRAGNLYVNVHSANHKPGEIRGQLKP